MRSFIVRDANGQQVAYVFEWRRFADGMPAPENWTLDRQPVPDPGPGQILVKAKWLSVDPYMRGRMSLSANYTKGVAIGEVMQGGGAGEVVASNHPAWKVGEIAEFDGLRLARMVGVDA